MVPLFQSIRDRQDEGGRLWYPSFRASKERHGEGGRLWYPSLRASKRDKMKVGVYGTTLL